MKKENTRMPFEVKRIRRRPGQSAGEHWRAIVDKGLEDAAPWVSAAVMFLIIPVFQKYGMAFPVWAGVALAAGVALWLWYKVKKIQRDTKSWRLGENGEQYVGQILERDMRPLGYDVFHDTVIKKAGRTFNLDHVLIGPNGVYVVETKAWHKPEKGAPEIEYNGGRLYRMGREIKDDAVKEVVSLAREANRLFADLTGRSYYVKPILVIAGWFCKNCDKNNTQFMLLNEKQVALWVSKDVPQRSPDPKDLELLKVKLEQYEP